MSVPVCEHIKPSGARCASPAMRGQHFCYYHVGARECLPVSRGMFQVLEPGSANLPAMAEFPIPFLEDAAAIQIGYMQALYGITSHRLDPKQARLVLAALDGARTNLKQMEACVSACANSVSDKKGKITRVSKTASPFDKLRAGSFNKLRAGSGAPARARKKEPVGVKTVETKGSRRAAKEAV